MRSERGASLISLLIVLVIVGLVSYLVISRTASNRIGALADAGLQLDDTKQQRTLSDMRTIGDAIRLMQTDTGKLPLTLADLSAGGYLVIVPANDGWGNAWVYTNQTDAFSLRSLGSDGRAGPEAPEPWTRGSHACDLILTNGQFTQAPGGRER